MSQTWNSQLKSLANVHRGFQRGLPGSERRFSFELRNTLVQVETPTQFGQLLRLLRDGRTVGVAAGATTRSNWETGKNLPSEKVLHDYLNSLSVPDTMWIHWVPALGRVKKWARDERKKEALSTAVKQTTNPQRSGQPTDDDEHTNHAEPGPLGMREVSGLDTQEAPATPKEGLQSTSEMQHRDALFRRLLGRRGIRLAFMYITAGVAVGVIAVVANLIILPAVPTAPTRLGNIEPPPMNARILLRSVNYPDRYLGITNGAARLLPVSTNADRARSALVLKPGLLGQGVSLQLADAPDRYLRGRMSYLWAESKARKDTVFDADATFIIEPARSDQPGLAFRSSNYPDSYIRHFDSQFFVESPTGHPGTPFAEDTAFVWVPA